VSLGLLGVITEVTLQCEPAFRLQETMEKRSLNGCLEDLDGVSHSAEHVKLWLEFYSGTCDIYRFNRTEKEPQMNSVVWRNLKVFSCAVWGACGVKSDQSPAQFDPFPEDTRCFTLTLPSYMSGSDSVVWIDRFPSTQYVCARIHNLLH